MHFRLVKIYQNQLILFLLPMSKLTFNSIMKYYLLAGNSYVIKEFHSSRALVLLRRVYFLFFSLQAWKCDKIKEESPFKIHFSSQDNVIFVTFFIY